MAVQDYYNLFQKYGQQYGVDPRLLMAMAQQESSGDPNATGKPTKFGTARGLMGILDSTAQSSGVDATNPDQAIAFAARQMAANIKQTGGNTPLALKLYHGGPDQNQWGPQTAQYPDLVTAKYAKLGAPTASTPDYFGQTYEGAPKPAASPQAASSTPDYFSKAYTDKAATGSPNSSNLPTITPTVNQPVQGAVQGVRDIISSFDPIAKSIESVTGPVTLGGLLPSAQQAAANNLAARQTFNASPAGQSVSGQVGRFGGQVAATIPAISAGGAALSPILSGVRTLAPAAADFLAGTGAYASKGAVNPLLRVLSGAARGAPQGAAAAALASSTSNQPVGQQVLGGAETGGILGGGMSGASRLLNNLGQTFRGGPISPERAALAQTAQNLGINLRPSQVSEHPFINYLDSNISKVPGSGLEADNEAQRAAFTGAVARTFGENGATGLTPELMTRAKERIGGVFNRVAANTALDAKTIPSQLSQIVQDAQQNLAEGEVTPIQKQIENITSKIDPKTKTIPGSIYQALTSKDAPLDRALSSSNPNIRFYATQIKNTLDDALENSAAPEDLADLRTARLQYKNLMTVKNLAAGANIEGEITPSALLGAVKKSYKNMAFSGAGDIGNLAHIGGDFLKPPPSSGSGERTMLYLALGGLGQAATESAFTGSAWPLIRDAGALGATMGGARLIGNVLRKGPPAVPPAVGAAVNQYGIPISMLGVNALLGGQ